MTVLLAATAAILFGLGTYLVLQRKLSRIIIGIALLSHGANVLMVGSGRRGSAPIVGNGDPAELADPLPQALALTSIVISFGVTALLLALAYRSWLLSSDDEVRDDLEDARIASHGALDEELAGMVGVDDEDGPDDVLDDAETGVAEAADVEGRAMTALVTLPIMLPLLAAAVSILVGRSRTVQRVLGLSTLTAVLAMSVALLVEVDRHGPWRSRPGDGRHRWASRSWPTGCRPSCWWSPR